MFIRDEILKELTDSVIEVTFLKKDGITPPPLRCTLMPRILPPAFNDEDRKQMQDFHNREPNLVASWNVQRNSWCVFPIDMVEYIQAQDNY
jgi:hypothetical protein